MPFSADLFGVCGVGDCDLWPDARKLARGATCTGGDIDCLKRAGANVYDAVTSHEGGEYDAIELEF